MSRHLQSIFQVTYLRIKQAPKQSCNSISQKAIEIVFYNAIQNCWWSIKYYAITSCSDWKHSYLGTTLKNKPYLPAFMKNLVPHVLKTRKDMAKMNSKVTKKATATMTPTSRAVWGWATLKISTSQPFKWTRGGTVAYRK